MATVVWKEGEWQLEAMVVWPIPGHKHSVPRSETLALVMALEMTSGDLLFVTGHEALVKA